MASRQPLVTIISVNYNEPEETSALLESLYQSDYTHFETYVVDNGSKRKISMDLETQYPNLKCIIHPENLGFAGGNNLAIEKGQGEYFLFLNNDTLIPPNFISKMIEFMESNPTVGIASPKVIYPDGVIQYAGATNINPLTGRGKTIGLFQEDKGQYDKIYATDYPHGAAMIVSRKSLDKVGKMPEEYFLYYEELDWCMQIKRMGFQMYYVGTTYVIHKESISVGTDSPLKVYYMNRSRLLYQKRNTTGFHLFSGIFFFLFVALPKASVKYMLAGKKAHLVSLWRGTFWHFNKNYVFKS